MLVRCAFCGGLDTHVVDSRLAEPADAVRRRRRCRSCDRRFTTYERYDQGPLYIRKRDGSRQPFDRAKLMAGLERAAIKRPVEREQLEALVDRIVAELRAEGGTPAPSASASSRCGACKELDRSPMCASRRSTGSSPTSRSSRRSWSGSRPSRRSSGSTSSSPLRAPAARSVRARSQSTEFPREPGK